MLDPNFQSKEGLFNWCIPNMGTCPKTVKSDWKPKYTQSYAWGRYGYKMATKGF